MYKKCVHCSAPFEVRKEDVDFYKLVSPEIGGKVFEIPPPTLCPFCRMQRRLCYRNERHLYHRKCDLTGKQIISSFCPEVKHPVYDIETWWSDEWDPLEYGQDFDDSRPFFEQWKELRDKVPRLALQQQRPMENSEYCNCASKCKNCYLTFSTNHCEDCYYGAWINHCSSCIDNKMVEGCELLYECVSCWDCYNLRYSRDCVNCRDSMFLRGCQGCSNCFGCSNQINKSYMVFNEQKSKEEYEEFMKQVNTGSYRDMEQAKERVDGILNDILVKHYHGSNTDNCIGDYLLNCKNAYWSYECDDCEDIAYAMCVRANVKSCMDYSYWGQGAEQVYECQASGYSLFNVRFCNLCWQNCSELLYCDQCTSTKNCFGCVGLKNAEYCIFNKQYTKKEYEELVPRIIEHMQKTGEWGEFFPISMSNYPFNQSLAYEQQALSGEEAEKIGYWWYEEDEKDAYMGPEVELPDNIVDAPDDTCDKVHSCNVKQKLFKIVPQEFSFYKEQRIPLPRKCFDQRHEERLKFMNPRKLWDRKCAKCQKEIQTTYAPDRPETVYCEECYLDTVY